MQNNMALTKHSIFQALDLDFKDIGNRRKAAKKVCETVAAPNYHETHRFALLDGGFYLRDGYGSSRNHKVTVAKGRLVGNSLNTGNDFLDDHQYIFYRNGCGSFSSESFDIVPFYQAFHHRDMIELYRRNAQTSPLEKAVNLRRPTATELLKPWNILPCNDNDGMPCLTTPCRPTPTSVDSDPPPLYGPFQNLASGDSTSSTSMCQSVHLLNEMQSVISEEDENIGNNGQREEWQLVPYRPVSPLTIVEIEEDEQTNVIPLPPPPKLLDEVRESRQHYVTRQCNINHCAFELAGIMETQGGLESRDFQDNYDAAISFLRDQEQRGFFLSEKCYWLASEEILPGSPGMMFCPFPSCQQTSSFQSRTQFCQHFTEAHSVFQKKLQCPEMGCQWEHTEASSMKQHMRQKGHNGETVVIFRIPNEKFAQALQLYYQKRENRGRPEFHGEDIFIYTELIPQQGLHSQSSGKRINFEKAENGRMYPVGYEHLAVRHKYKYVKHPPLLKKLPKLTGMHDTAAVAPKKRQRRYFKKCSSDDLESHSVDQEESHGHPPL